MGIFTKSLLVVFGRLSTGHCLAVYAMSREIIRIYRKSGALFLGQYLKQVAFATMQYVGGGKVVGCSKVYISLTRGGLPRFIPPHYRRCISGGELPPVQVVLSVCALSRILRVGKGRRVDSSTINQLGFRTKPEFADLCEEIRTKAFSFLQHYSPSMP